MKVKLLIAQVLVLICAVACIKQQVTHEEELPSAFTYPVVNNVVDFPVDSGSFVGLHKYIFSTTCAVSGCHDGSFAPDFRTVQSAYNTLVNHEIVKNTNDNRFEYLVIPNDVANSMLYERITTTDPVLGRMPLYDFPLTTREVGLIEDWINAGAPDGFGNSPTVIDEEPAFFGIVAYLNTHLDSIEDELIMRTGEITDPYEFPKDTIVKIWFGLYDFDANGEFYPGHELTFNKVKFSNKFYDFVSKPYVSMTIEGLDSYLLAPIMFNPDADGPYFHHVTINTKDYAVGEIVYMRVYVQDADHASPTELPETGSPAYLNAYFSFKIVP
jgi:hypothetical protein